MTKQTYTVHAWCVRPFITVLEVEANTPEQAIVRAMNRPDRLLDMAEECNEHYPWEEYAVDDERGHRLLHVLTDEARIRNAAPDLMQAVVIAENYLADDLDEEDEDEMRIFTAICDARAKARG